MLKIGISSCFFHADPQRAIFKGKALLYMEESLGHWVGREGALTYMIPTPAPGSRVRLRDLVRELDGLVLSGGADVAPETYGETAMKPEWSGDAVRDQYEIQLIQEFMTQRKPVLGVCRGAQVLNVAFGGTLYQDIQTQVPGALVHRDWNIYDQNFHRVRLEGGSLLAELHGGLRESRVNSVHHQAIRKLGKGLVVEAVSPVDGIIEAIHLKDSETFVYGVQWHPEFQSPEDSALLSGRPILEKFLQEVQIGKEV